MNETYPYPYSAAEARKRNELSLWRESHRANIACRDAIENAIRQNFDGMNLQTDCLKAVLDEYGYKRTAWVLANTLHELKWDGRFSYANKHWAQTGYNLSSRNLIWDTGRIGLVVSHNGVNDGDHLPAGVAHGRHVGFPFISFFLKIKLQRRIVKHRR